MNKINTKKLLNSKWTTFRPINKEKHFLISKLEFDENDKVYHCLIEAVISSRIYSINLTELKESKRWIRGWK